MFEEFKKFAFKGNVIDLAVAVVIGTAFGKIVSSLVEKIIMPLVGLITGGNNFSRLSITLKKASLGQPGLTLDYGIFIGNVIDFLIISFSIFIVIRQINKFNKKQEPEIKTPEEKPEIVLLREIRDSLNKKSE